MAFENERAMFVCIKQSICMHMRRDHVCVRTHMQIEILFTS